MTGDAKYRQQAEEMVDVSFKKLGPGADERKDFADYAERIHYRLDNRTILSKAQYDLKFRSQASK